MIGLVGGKSRPLRELASAIGDELGLLWGLDRAIGGQGMTIGRQGRFSGWQVRAIKGTSYCY